ncbi:MAG TPA: O-antigen ligase family protein [Gaiellaceae bacterium]|nr:O-antigen ligase family protein [Gaiellaceae bacterium]
MTARSWAPAAGPRRSLSLLVAVAGAAAVAVAGGAYAIGSYRLDDPTILPIVAAGLAAVTLGLWRLEYGLALLIVLTPLAENAPIAEPENARLRVALVAWAMVLVGLQAVRSVLSGRRLEVPPVFAGALAFVGAALAAVPFAGDGQAAASKFLLLAGSVFIYLLIALFLDDWRSLRPIFAALLVVGLVVAVHALWQYATGQLSRVGFVSATGAVEYRVASFFPHPNQLAGFVVLFVPLSIGLYRVFESPLAKAASLVLALVALPAAIVTYSRGVLVALVALVLAFARNRKAWPLIAAAAVLVVLLAPAAWQDRVADVGRLDRPEIATRLDFWEASVAMFQAHPVVGVGLNNFEEAYAGLELTGRSFLPGGGLTAPETAHNLYLNTLAEQGLVGIAALALLVLAAARMVLALRRSHDPRIRGFGLGLMGAGIALLVSNLFDVTFVDPKTSMLAWTLLGVGAALQRIDARTRGEAAASPPE